MSPENRVFPLEQSFSIPPGHKHRSAELYNELRSYLSLSDPNVAPVVARECRQQQSEYTPRHDKFARKLNYNLFGKPASNNDKHNDTNAERSARHGAMSNENIYQTDGRGTAVNYRASFSWWSELILYFHDNGDEEATLLTRGTWFLLNTTFPTA